MELVLGLGAMMMIEGVAYALFPDGMRKLCANIAVFPIHKLRTAGLLMAVLGFVVMAMVRGMP